MIVLTSVLGNFAIPTVSASSSDVLNKAYITSYGSGKVDVIDLETGEVELGKITVGSEPNSAAISPQGNQVLVTNRGNNSVSVIDPATDTVVGTIDVEGGPHGVTYNQDGSLAYVANYFSHTISVIDTAALTVIDTISTGASSSPVIAFPIGDKLYVSLRAAKAVLVVDLTTKQTSSINVGHEVYSMSIDPTGTKLYVAVVGGNQVAVIDLATDSIEATINLGAAPYAIELSPDGSRAYTANADNGTVSIIDTTTNTVIETVSVGASPYVIGVSRDGSKVYSVNYSSSNMSEIDTATNTLTRNITLSSGPFMVGTFMMTTFAAQNPGTPSKSSNSALAELTISDGTLSPAFDKATTEYTVNVDHTTESITLNGVTDDSKATITVNGEEVSSGSDFSIDLLGAGLTTVVEVEVTAEDGSITTYTIEVVRATAPSSNSELSSLTISRGTLTPAFDSETTTYKATVDYATTSLTINATAADAAATITVNDVAVNEDNTSEPVALKVGHNIITIEVTAEDGTTTTYSLDVLRRAASTPVVDETPVSTPEPSPTTQVLLDDEKQEQLATARKAKINDQDALIVELDNDKVIEQLANNNKQTISIPFPANSGTAIGVLNGELAKTMETKQMTLQLTSEHGGYSLPMSALNIDNVAGQFGNDVNLADIVINVQMSQVSSQATNTIAQAASNQNLKLVGVPMSFEVTATWGGKTVVINQFDQLVTRNIELPEGTDTAQLTTGVVAREDGTLAHVPTYITVGEDGKASATINSLTNSSYALVYSPKTFTDTLQHWAKDDIADMASRLVIQGVSNELFLPNQMITRAEFVTMMVKALGLPLGIGSEILSDVNANDWHADAIQTALSYQLINGYSDGSFRPNQSITRQEIAAIISRALTVIGQNSELTAAEVNDQLAAFKDADSIATWAKKDLASVVRNGIVQGHKGIIAANDQATRAEATTMIRRLLQTTELINK